MTTETCDYCDTTNLVYRLESDRGAVNRCIPCLAIEQGQQKFQMPFEVWLDRDDIEPPDQDKFPDAPDFDAFDPREHDYKTARAWFTVLARVRSDKPILKRDPEAIGTIFEDTREFLINFMGADAHKRPSELVSSAGSGNDQTPDSEAGDV